MCIKLRAVQAANSIGGGLRLALGSFSLFEPKARLRNFTVQPQLAAGLFACSLARANKMSMNTKPSCDPTPTQPKIIIMATNRTVKDFICSA
jgi:hypothetical protein